MSTKQDIVSRLVGPKKEPQKKEATSFAPANIALIKYWGKRDNELNLPVTSSVSLSLSKGTHTKITSTNDCDTILLNGKECAKESTFSKRLINFLDLVRAPGTYFRIETTNEIPTASGFASSSSGFAALVKALNELYSWNADDKTLSILARLGSGSASRSIYTGFVEWHAGSQPDGLDSYSEPLNTNWNEPKIGLITISDKEKPIDSRQAMKCTVETAMLYKAWPEQVARDLASIKHAINTKDFSLLGKTAESNALAMHATMIASSPPILYWLPESVAVMHTIWQLRKDGLELYFTMDAGPNVKIIYREQDKAPIAQSGLHFT